LLLVASLLFYAWGEGLFLAVLIVSIAVNYAVGRAIGEPRPGRRRSAALALGVVANLGLLGCFKYAQFAVDNLNALLAPLGLGPLELREIHLPIGISFFTFQALSYLIDLYRGVAPLQRNPFRVALYIALFPQLIAGPIVRYQQIAAQLVSRVVDAEGFAAGLRRLVVGLAKKVLLANALGEVSDEIFGLPASRLGAGAAWLGALAFSLQIYFDFSGYSDMAIGLGRMFGFRIPENFLYPYVATSLADHWRRWHISLSTWLRDYLYVPLARRHRGSPRAHLQLFTVFLLCGLWHGAAWHYVAWGGIHGFFLALERMGWGRVLARAPRPLRHAYVLLVVAVAMVVFRAESLAQAAVHLAAMSGAGSAADAAAPGTLLTPVGALALVVAIVASTPLLASAWPRLARLRGPLGAGRTLVPALRLASVLALFALSLTSLVAQTHEPFIYFRF
jgi:alginate O-acetyltransferase complex protein AlgI